MDTPIYHLRPNKTVDRNLFAESLMKLGKIQDLTKYRYIGFGSYEFDDFKLIYRTLGISDFHSIEYDSDIYKRQTFNKPYSFIELYNKTCGTYFDEDYDEEKHSIIWVDFSEANNKYEQCQDISNICGKISANDILRITFNANASGIPLLGNLKLETEIPSDQKRVYRYNWLKENLGDFFPDDSSAEEITSKQYPLFLLKVLKKAVYQCLNRDCFACPISIYLYSDSTQMMTVTIFIGLSKNKEALIKDISKAFIGWDNFVTINRWDNPITINLPALTVHEQLEIRQYGEGKENLKKVKEKLGISEEDIIKYIQFARYYPNYQPIVI